MGELRIGGQAVMNGVMMRSKKYIATSVRKKDGTIKTKTRKFISLTEKNKVLGFPFIRGTIMLFELMIIGMKELTWSSNESTDDKDEQLSKKEIILTIFLSILFALALFKLLPWFLANTVSGFIETSVASLNFLDAIFKVLILAAYIYLISLMPDIKTLFRYHGAEHKAVSCYESGQKLTPKNADKFSVIHPRCGTTFIILVFFISIFFYMLIPTTDFWYNYIVRILLLPIIAGTSFELIRFGGKHYYKSAVVRIIMWPGLQFQRLTTRQPGFAQLEVAIKSLNTALKKEKS